MEHGASFSDGHLPSSRISGPPQTTRRDRLTPRGCTERFSVGGSIITGSHNSCIKAAEVTVLSQTLGGDERDYHFLLSTWPTRRTAPLAFGTPFGWSPVVPCEWHA